MTICAVHPFFQMDVFQVHGLLEFFWIIGRDHAAVLVEQVAFSISFEDGPEYPSVTVKIAELSILEFAVELGGADFFQEFEIRPQASRCRPLRIASCYPTPFFLAGIAFRSGI